MRAFFNNLWESGSGAVHSLLSCLQPKPSAEKFFAAEAPPLCKKPFTHQKKKEETAPMSSQLLHPQDQALAAPDGNCQTDHWYLHGNPYNTWHSCRDTGTSELLRQKNKKRLLCYRFGNEWYHKPDSLYTNEQVCENIARLFQHVEDRMGWWDRTRVHPTEHPGVVNVYFSGGWLQNNTAAWLGTLILRLGGHFGPNRTLDWTLKQHEYGAYTIPAIHRFLQGCQHYTGIVEGWYVVFWWRTWESACSMLIHTDTVREQAYLLAEKDRFRKKPSVYWLKACQSLNPCPGDPANVEEGVYGADVQQRWPEAA